MIAAGLAATLLAWGTGTAGAATKSTPAPVVSFSGTHFPKTARVGEVFTGTVVMTNVGKTKIPAPELSLYLSGGGAWQLTGATATVKIAKQKAQPSAGTYLYSFSALAPGRTVRMTLRFRAAAAGRYVFYSLTPLKTALSGSASTLLGAQFYGFMGFYSGPTSAIRRLRHCTPQLPCPSHPASPAIPPSTPRTASRAP